VLPRVPGGPDQRNDVDPVVLKVPDNGGADETRSPNDGDFSHHLIAYQSGASGCFFEDTSRISRIDSMPCLRSQPIALRLPRHTPTKSRSCSAKQSVTFARWSVPLIEYSKCAARLGRKQMLAVSLSSRTTWPSSVSSTRAPGNCAVFEHLTVP